MAVTTFSDIIFDPELFMEYMEEFSPNPAAFIQSGILRNDPAIASRISGEGNLYTAPFFKPLTGVSQNYAGADITVNAIESESGTGIVIGRANAWGSQDLAAELATKDPMVAIAGKVTKYWQEERQRLLIAQLNGVFASTAMAGHVYSTAIEDGDNATDANLMGAGMIIDGAQFALGDNASKIVAIAVHSKVFARMQKLNLIEFLPLADQTTRVPYFLDKAVIVDDTLPVVAGTTSGNKYASYLFAAQSVGTAEGKVKTPVETQRDSLKSGGIEWLVNRQRFTYHPYGSSFIGSMAGISPTDAELATGTNYDLVYEPKNFAIVKVVTNG